MEEVGFKADNKCWGWGLEDLSTSWVVWTLHIEEVKWNYEISIVLFFFFEEFDTTH